jgi:uncharacterized protein YkwD
MAKVNITLKRFGLTRIAQKAFIFSLFFAFACTQFTFAKLNINYPWSTNSFISSLNQERKKQKLNPIKSNKELERLANARLDDMVSKNYFAHYCTNCQDVDTLLASSTYSYEFRGENLAYGEYENENDVTKAWMRSQSHKFNILYPAFEEIGVAYKMAKYKNGYYLVVVTVFGKPKPNSTSSLAEINFTTNNSNTSTVLNLTALNRNSAKI